MIDLFPCTDMSGFGARRAILTRTHLMSANRQYLSSEDPDDVFELTEILASGAYGSVYKVLCWVLRAREIAVV
jgi:hypothetical protein